MEICNKQHKGYVDYNLFLWLFNIWALGHWFINMFIQQLFSECGSGYFFVFGDVIVNRADTSPGLPGTSLLGKWRGIQQRSLIRSHWIRRKTGESDDLEVKERRFSNRWEWSTVSLFKDVSECWVRENSVWLWGLIEKWLNSF